MSEDLPPIESVLPAVEHVMGTLDHDAGTIQGIADRLTQSVGASIDSDKSTLQKIKTRLSRSVNNSVIKQDGPVLTEIGRRMRNAVAVPIDSDQQVIDRIVARLPDPGGLMAPSPLSPIPPIPRPPTSPPTASRYGYWYCAPPGGMYGGLWHWRTTYDPNRPPDGPPPPGDVNGRGVQREGLGLDWLWLNPDGSYASAGCADGAPSPTILPPPSTPPGIIPPPIPQPAPPPSTPPVPPAPPSPYCSPQACGPLPSNIPCVAVYVVPWLDPGDVTPSTSSECGKKLIADSLGTEFPASEASVAMQSFQGVQDWIGARPNGPMPDIGALLYRDPSPGEEEP